MDSKYKSKAYLIKKWYFIKNINYFKELISYRKKDK